MKLRAQDPTGAVPHPTRPGQPIVAEPLDIEIDFAALPEASREAISDLDSMYAAMDKLKEEIKQREITLEAEIDHGSWLPEMRDHEDVTVTIKDGPIAVMQVKRGTSRTFDPDMIDTIYGASVPDYIRKTYSLTPAQMNKLPEGEQLQLSDAIVWKPRKIRTKKV
jgi:hypothetical protein